MGLIHDENHIHTQKLVRHNKNNVPQSVDVPVDLLGDRLGGGGVEQRRGDAVRLDQGRHLCVVFMYIWRELCGVCWMIDNQTQR